MEKKSKILIFAGTTEGRELAEFLSEREVEAEISVKEFGIKGRSLVFLV